MNVAIPDTTMSSREIAMLAGKRHDHVIRDIEKMFRDLEINPPKFGGVYLDAKGEERKEYNLPKNLTMNLVTGYRADLRLKVIDRLLLLEAAERAQAAPAVDEETISRIVETVITRLGPVLARAQASAQESALRMPPPGSYPPGGMTADVMGLPWPECLLHLPVDFYGTGEPILSGEWIRRAAGPPWSDCLIPSVDLDADAPAALAGLGFRVERHFDPVSGWPVHYLYMSNRAVSPVNARLVRGRPGRPPGWGHIARRMPGVEPGARVIRYSKHATSRSQRVPLHLIMPVGGEV